MKRLLLFLLLVVLATGLGYLGKVILWPEQLDKKIAANIDVDLSLKGITLSQGRQGKQLWNLNATGALYAEGTDELALEMPCITYWGENATETIVVCAPNGLVWQKQDRAKMWNGVNASRGDYDLFSSDLMYTGDVKELVLTGDVQVRSTTMQARSDELTYFIESGDFSANGNVAVTLNR